MQIISCTCYQIPGVFTDLILAASQASVITSALVQSPVHYYKMYRRFWSDENHNYCRIVCSIISQCAGFATLFFKHIPTFIVSSHNFVSTVFIRLLKSFKSCFILVISLLNLFPVECFNIWC